LEQKIYASFDAAVADIPDGASIMLGGFGPGTPHNLIGALYRHTAKDLMLIANAIGVRTAGPGVTTAGELIETKRVKKVLLSFTASTHPSRRSAVELAHEAGELETEITPQGTLAERIRAGGAGIPAFYTPAGIGTELEEGKEKRVFNGQTYLLEEAITADYAFVRAWKADAFGNLVYRLSQRNFNPHMATAARCTIAEVEEIVPIGSLAPDQVHTAGIHVHRIVLIGPDDVLHPRMTSTAAGDHPAQPAQNQT
jgi:3-oxoacid CoA-transferase A subunit